MAKNFSRGIDNVFRTTVRELEEVKEEKVTAPIAEPEPEKEEVKTTPKKVNENDLVSYNLRYPREIQKMVKRFCIEHDGIDMKDVFTQGAIMYINEYKNKGIGALVD